MYASGRTLLGISSNRRPAPLHVQLHVVGSVGVQKRDEKVRGHVRIVPPSPGPHFMLPPPSLACKNTTSSKPPPRVTQTLRRAWRTTAAHLSSARTLTQDRHRTDGETKAAPGSEVAEHGPRRFFGQLMEREGERSPFRGRWRARLCSLVG